MVQLYIIHPIGNLDLPSNALPGSGISGRPDNSLPGRPDHIGGGPIYHPGHPEHGLPSGGHIGNQLPWAPGHPDNSLPVPPGVGTAPVPPDLADKLVVLWHLPNTVEWHGKVIDPSLRPDQGLPPTGEPKSA